MDGNDRDLAAPEILSKLEDIADEVRISAKTIVFRQGELAQFIYFVQWGALRMDHHLEDGRNLVLDFSWKGEFFGLAEERFYSRSAITLVDTGLKRMRRDSLRKLSRTYPAITDLLMAQKNAFLVAAKTHMILLACPRAIEKVIGFLVACTGRLDCYDSVTRTLTLVMSRKDIADYLGMSIETTSRIFRRLEMSGYIKRIDSRNIRLGDKIMTYL